MRETFKYQKKTIIYSYAVYILISIALIIGLSHYCLKLLNGLRAFSSGESLYMKAQHEATRNLTNYVFTSKAVYYDLFIEKLEVPISDSLARVSMDMNQDVAIIKRLLLKGKNAPEDADNIIWVYNNFKTTGKFSQAVSLWKEADSLVIALQQLGKQIHDELENDKEMPIEQRKLYATKIDHLSRLITIKGNNFDSALIANVTFVNKTVMLLNTVIALIIASCLLALSLKYINRLSALQRDTLTQNKALRQTNAEMDLFTYSVSHDLRTPISSLLGIISLLEIEQADGCRQVYLQKMKHILHRQDEFILKIVQFSRNKRTDLNPNKVYLPTFFDHIIEDLKYAAETFIEINLNIEDTNIQIDEFRLDIICRNIISNAIKYTDNNKDKRCINISANTQHHNCLNILVEDNGIGVEDIHREKIFDMFYVTSHRNKGSGIGLYLVKEMVSKLEGKISFRSTFGQGSKVALSLPLKNEAIV